MDPITIMAGVSVISSLAQLYQSEKARGAEQSRLKDIQKLYDAVTPPDYDMSIMAPPEMHTEALQKPQFSGPMNAPSFDMTKLAPEAQKMLQKYLPQLTPYMPEEAVQVIQKTEDMKTGRQAQLAALRRMQAIGDGEFDPEYAQKVQDAARSAQGEAQSRQASIMQDFARRGIAGSGLNLAAQMGAAAQSMDRSAMVNQQAATDAYRNRLNALMSGANLGGQISQEDMNFQARNTDIINAFNERVSRNRQNLASQNTAMMNDADRYNVGMAQGIEGQNVDARNRAAMSDQARMDNLVKYGASFAEGERDRADRNAQFNYGADRDERNYSNTLAQSQANWNASERDRLNKLRAAQYQDKIDASGMKAGVMRERSAADISGAQDRNAAIQGLANAGMSGAMYAQSRADAKNDAFNNANLRNYTNTGSFIPEEDKDKYYKTYGG